jgi:hypothetical protein
MSKEVKIIREQLRIRYGSIKSDGSNTSSEVELSKESLLLMNNAELGIFIKGLINDITQIKEPIYLEKGRYPCPGCGEVFNSREIVEHVCGIRPHKIEPNKPI